MTPARQKRIETSLKTIIDKSLQQLTDLRNGDEYTSPEMRHAALIMHRAESMLREVHDMYKAEKKSKGILKEEQNERV